MRDFESIEHSRMYQEFNRIYQEWINYCEPLFEMRANLCRRYQYIYHPESGQIDRFLSKEDQEIDDKLVEHMEFIKSMFFKYHLKGCQL